MDLMEAAKSFIRCMASDQTRVLVFTKKKKRHQFHSLLPTSSNLFVHVIRAHLLVMLWNICDGILLLHYTALTQLSDGRSCQCRTQDKNAAELDAAYFMLVILQLFWRREMLSTLREKRFRRVSRCSILRRDVNVMIKRMVLLILIKYV